MSGGFRSRSSGAKRTEGNGGHSRREETGQPRNRRQSPGRGPRPDQRRPVPVPRDAGVDSARLVAFQVLRRVSEDDAFANLTLPALLREQKLSGRDAAFATELTYGTLRTLGVLDAVIQDASTRPLTQIAPEVLDALRLGTYQLLYTRVDAHAAVDTTVRLVESTGNLKAKGFANAIMRTVSRTPADTWLQKLTPPGDLEAIAFRTAHPRWIAESFARVLGPEEVEEALQADSERPIVHLAARPGEMSAEELALITGGEEGTYSPYAVYLESGNPADLDPVREGLALVQDEGSQLIARATAEAPLEGEDSGRWLDLCAGPGGKAALMGALARIDGAQVDAVEISSHRADLIRGAVRDLPVTVHTADGRNPGLTPGYDRVLVDAPCTGLGALRRRAEARWRKQESDISELNVLQYELLTSALELVRPGGVVVYSTCSPDLRETRAIVDKAVAELGAVELDAHPLVPDMPGTGEEKSVQMWPHRHGTDAMFFAVLRR